MQSSACPYGAHNLIREITGYRGGTVKIAHANKYHRTAKAA